MTSSIPEPLRAVAGLAAVAIDETKGLPRKLTSLPVVALGAAMQVSLRLRQSYAGLVVRGDELLTQLGAGSDEAPSWAKFDDEPDESPNGSAAAGNQRSRFDAQPDPDPDPLADEPPVSATAQTSLAPVRGYDGFSLAQLRGRLRGYDAETLAALLAYERAGAARPAYLTMLENRLATLGRS